MGIENNNIIKSINLKDSKNLILRKPLEYDAENIIKYLNTVGSESNNLLFGKGEFPLTVEQEKAYISRINQSSNSFMVLGTINNEIVSVAQLSSPNMKRISHNSAIAISVKKDYWNIGIGSAVMEELIKFAKDKGSIKTISLGVREYNNIAIKLYEKYGFKKIGTHKNYFNIEETYYDKILMDLYI
ncbi:GNAT family N-acetyltransferase [Clostridium perfringens]|uniref:GNAT family N-acetyltransferase n=2 Tax=Clostridium perfringens TaxID=1502 RepID=A0AAW9KE83_CLOPF|nr:GNAT family N-acetyltransferase [Clostridium perfringens]MBI5976603.1 GNAT family N-acetyltransferase [Clostridium perfringens]MBI5979666.1 GNAT family N-acetyltransferase [Clostridium perfringens]MBI5983493.1 GNAT family N-acetyltransferase [Clostridium perfringens]MBI5987798.1 GNAT family N-acetyltransferase [Clostridium perfringens]MBI5995490.1 GNAT family N-acetyltransferase [Clostridium perfringens]